MKPILKSALVADTAWWAVVPTIEQCLLELSGLLAQVEEAIPSCTTLVRKKRHASAQEKLGRKGYQSYMECTDLVKGSVITNSIDEVVSAALILSSIGQVVKLEVKTGSPSNPYCGAIHLDLLINGLTCEIQIMTATSWSIKKESNSFYKQGRPAEGASLWVNAPNFNRQHLCTLQG